MSIKIELNVIFFDEYYGPDNVDEDGNCMVEVEITNELALKIDNMSKCVNDYAYIIDWDYSFPWDKITVDGEEFNPDVSQIVVDNNGSFKWKCYMKHTNILVETDSTNIAQLTNRPLSGNYVDQIEPLVEEHVKSHTSDFGSYDKPALDGYEGEFIWACRPTGTDLLCLDDQTFQKDEVVKAFIASHMKENEFQDKLWENASAVFTLRESNQHFYHGLNGIVRKVERQDAVRIVGRYFNIVYNNAEFRAEAVKRRMKLDK